MSFLTSFSVMLILSLGVLYAQDPSETQVTDFNPISPNTVRVIAKVKSIQNDSAVIAVQKVIGSGQGIINILSYGQELSIFVSPEKKKLLSGEIEVDLKEKLGVDASQSYYVSL